MPCATAEPLLHHHIASMLVNMRVLTTEEAVGSSEGRGPPDAEAVLGAMLLEGRSLKLLLRGFDSASGPLGAAPALQSIHNAADGVRCD